jgi:Protein of unknown function (DUF3102)
MSKAVKTRAQWAAEICAAHKQSIDGILKMGRTLIAAKKALEHGAFEKMIERDLPFDASTAQRLMKIARDSRICKAAHGQLLPATWRTLYELTKLPDKAFEQAAASGAIHPKMTREGARLLNLKVHAKQGEAVRSSITLYPSKEDKPLVRSVTITSGETKPLLPTAVPYTITGKGKPLVPRLPAYIVGDEASEATPWSPPNQLKQLEWLAEELSEWAQQRGGIAAGSEVGQRIRAVADRLLSLIEPKASGAKDNLVSSATEDT